MSGMSTVYSFSVSQEVSQLVHSLAIQNVCFSESVYINEIATVARNFATKKIKKGGTSGESNKPVNPYLNHFVQINYLNSQ